MGELLNYVKDGLLPNEEWTKEDTAQEVAFQILNIADWLQTKEIMDNPKYEEANPFLNNNKGNIDLVFPLVGIASYLLKKNLPKKQRDWAHKLGLGIKGGIVGNNVSLGVGFKF